MKSFLVALTLLVACSEKRADCDLAIDSPARAAACERACNEGNAEACHVLGYYYGAASVEQTDGGGFRGTSPRDPAKARELWKRACSLGFKRSCEELQ